MIPIPYNNLTSRSDIQARIPEEVSRAMLGKATEESAVLSMFRQIPVGINQVRFPVLSALPMAYFVQGDTGLKQTTEIAWTNKFMNVEEIATIMPVPDNVIADMEANIWDEAMPLLTEAFGRTLDNAVFFGTNKPSSWPTAVLPAIVAASNTVTEGTSNAAGGGYMGDLDNLIATVEEDGFEPSGFIASLSAKRKFRAARDTTGQKTDVGRFGGDLRSLDGYPITYPMRGLWPTGLGTGNNPRVIAGDWKNQFVVGIRQDIGMKILTESVIQDNTGAIVYNLAQQDMTALRLTFRIAFQVANTINNDNTDEASRYPAAALVY